MKPGARVLRYVDNEGRLREVFGVDPIDDYDRETAALDGPEVSDVNLAAKRSQIRRDVFLDLRFDESSAFFPCEPQEQRTSRNPYAIADYAPPRPPKPAPDAPRDEHKAYANAHGYYWSPCPRCGRWTGGHEAQGQSVACLRDQYVGHLACCARPGGDEPEACARAHAAHGE